MPNRDHDDTPYKRNEGRFESVRDDRDRGYGESRDWDRRDEFHAGEGRRSPGTPYDGGYNPARDDYDYRGGSRFEDRAQVPQSTFGGQRSWGVRPTFDQGNPGRYAGPGSSQGQGNYGGHDWNRDYTRDWDRDYRGDTRMSGQSNGPEWGEQLRHAGHQVLHRVKRAFRGPKGYKRSDERIAEDVNDRLAQQDEFDPSEIEVLVQNGEVTLVGSVRSRHEKFRAEEIADDVIGVGDVHNQLRVGAAPAAAVSAPVSVPSTSTSRNGRA
ncbi:MAG TPA: BON domain-containing protein [Polyangiales bacterium]